MQIVDRTNSENDVDDLATKVCDTLAFHEDEDNEINIMPESNEQIEPEAFCFSLRTELNLLREMKQLETEMMIQEDPFRTELETKVPTFAGDNHRRFWRRLFGRYRSDKHSGNENITNFSDWASTNAPGCTSEEQSDKGSCIKQNYLPQKSSRSLCQLVRRMFRKRKHGKRAS